MGRNDHCYRVGYFSFRKKVGLSLAGWPPATGRGSDIQGAHVPSHGMGGGTFAGEDVRYDPAPESQGSNRVKRKPGDRRRESRGTEHSGFNHPCRRPH